MTPRHARNLVRERWKHGVMGLKRKSQGLSVSQMNRWHGSLVIVKWTKKVSLWLINCALFNSFLVYKNLNPWSKFKYKEFLVQVAKAWATDGIQAAQTQTQTQCDLDHQFTPHVGLMWTPLDDFWLICGNMSSGKVWRVNMARGRIPARQCRVCAVHKSQTGYICELCIVPLHKGECFQRYLMLRHF
jgi:hypothetical protein